MQAEMCCVLIHLNKDTASSKIAVVKKSVRNTMGNYNYNTAMAVTSFTGTDS